MTHEEEFIRYWFEDGYIRLPRKIINSMFSEDMGVRRRYKVYCALLVLAHVAKFTQWQLYKENIEFKAGEVMITYRELSKRTDISLACIARILKDLEESGKITVRMEGSRYVFCLCHYEELTRKYLDMKTGKPKKPQVRTSPVQSGISEADKELFEENKRVYLRMRQRQKEEREKREREQAEKGNTSLPR